MKAIGIGTGNQGAQIFSTVQTSNGTNQLGKGDSKTQNPTNLTLNTFSSDTYNAGETLYFYIHLGSKANGGQVGFRDIVLSGTYQSASLTKLSTPSISINQATGVVTINDIDANASKVTYTTNGSDPTASSTTYDAENKPVLDANCTVKAIAIGDGVTFSNSNITSANAVVAVENPVITSHNGTVEITCATDGATIKYNFDNGESWNTYTQSFTLFTGETVYAKAEKADLKNNSSVVNSSVAAAPAKATGSLTKILSWIVPSDGNNWEYMSGDNGSGGTTNYGIRGKADTEEEGWALWLSPNGSSYYDKAIYGSGSYTISDTEYTYLRGSNGRQFNIDMPSNLRANRITLYSYNGMEGTSLWTPVCGTTYTTDSEIGIVSTSASSPEIRVFALDDVANTITLNNTGYQQLFIAVIDYTVYIPGPPAPQTVGGDALTWDLSSADAWTVALNGGEFSAPSNDDPISNTLYNTDQKKTITYVAGKNDSKTNTHIAANGSTKTNARYFVLQISSDGILGLTTNGNEGAFVVKKAANASTTWGEATDYSPAKSITTSTAGTEVTSTITYDADKPYILIGFPDSKRNIQKITWTPVSNDITLTTSANMAGWRAFYDASNGYTLDANTTAYVATAKNGSTVTMTPLVGGVPSGTPVILKTTSSADSYKMTLTKASVSAYEGTNLLSWTTSAVSNKYRLGYGDEGVGFYPYSGTPSSGAVILDISSSSSRALRLSFGSITGIEQVENGNIESSLPVKRIVNGKLVIEKKGHMFNANGQLIK